MRSFLLGTAALLCAGAAQAAPHVMDDFNTGQTVTDNTANGAPSSSSLNYSAEGLGYSRAVAVNQSANPSGNASELSQAAIGDGSLVLRNDGDTNAIFEFTYDIESIVDANSDGALSLVGQLLSLSDGAELFIDGYLNGQFLGRVDLTAFGPNEGQFVINLNGRQTDGNMLRLVFSGSAGFDATFSPLLIDVGRANPEEPVPAPGAVALLALGVAALASLRRRQRDR